MSGGGPRRLVSADEDSGRWIGFPYREGDIVISTRSKHGTTWMQMLCALLVFQTAELPAPLSRLSPWLDWLVLPRDELLADLDAQQHRRFIKTHTPLDGIPLDRRATYVVVARDPLDAAVSLYHQGENLDRVKIRRLTGQPEADLVKQPDSRPDLHEWLVGWTRREVDPYEAADSLNGVMWHLSDAWRRLESADVVLVRYSDLVADLDGQLRALADRLGITVPDDRWPSLVDAARFGAMSARADDFAPDPQGILKDRAAFFRRGSTGAGREVLTADEMAAYESRLDTLADPELLAWLRADPSAGRGSDGDHEDF